MLFRQTSHLTRQFESRQEAHQEDAALVWGGVDEKQFKWRREDSLKEHLEGRVIGL